MQGRDDRFIDAVKWKRQQRSKVPLLALEVVRTFVVCFPLVVVCKRTITLSSTHSMKRSKNSCGLSALFKQPSQGGATMVAQLKRQEKGKSITFALDCVQWSALKARLA